MKKRVQKETRQGKAFGIGSHTENNGSDKGKWKTLPDTAEGRTAALIDPDEKGSDGWGVLEIPVRLSDAGDERLADIPGVGAASMARWTQIAVDADGKVYEGAFFTAGDIDGQTVYREIGDDEARDFLLKNVPILARLFGPQPKAC